jgi:hypothetical protein
MDLILETTGGYASNLNGKEESLNDYAKGMVRGFLMLRSHTDDKWCFAFCYDTEYTKSPQYSHQNDTIQKVAFHQAIV